MLSSDQQAELAVAICATAEAMGQAISAGGAQLIAEDLSAYEPGVIIGALRACRREPAGRLSLGMVLKHIHAADSRPGKDEAWSIALAASDEHETVVLTTEIRQAMIASAPILEAGDKIGARMAFMSAYERLVSGARAEAKPAAWSVSLGFDPVRRVTAIESAVRMQLITQEAGTQYLADLRITPITTDGQAIAGLLTGATIQASPRLREKLAEVRSLVSAEKARQDRERLKRAQADRVNTYLRKRKAREAIDAVQRKEGI